MRWLLKGPAGAVQFLVYTGWLLQAARLADKGPWSSVRWAAPDCRLLRDRAVDTIQCRRAAEWPCRLPRSIWLTDHRRHLPPRYEPILSPGIKADASTATPASTSPMPAIHATSPG
jgi:hypothetical protein